MPTFIAQHIPLFPAKRMLRDSGFSDFVAGYFGAAEWLLPEEIDRDKIHGWSQDARVIMLIDCKCFWRENKADLQAYAVSLGFEGAGTDFYLTRERHGAGFWDRGLGTLGKRLSDSAKGYGEFGYPYLSRGWIRL